MQISRALCAGLIALLAFAAPAAAAPLDDFHKVFDQTMTQHGIVGGGFGFEHGLDRPAEFYFGEARADTHRKAGAETAYSFSSLTKTMTAIAILQLRDRGKLSLDDPAAKYLPELRQVHDAFGPIDAITIRQLLSHSAGFRNPSWPWGCDSAPNCGWAPFEPTRWSQISAMLPFTNIAFQPGSRWSYSNLGYIFLGQIVARLSGDDYETYIAKNILMPLGMTQSYFDRAPYYLEPYLSASYLRAGPAVTPQLLNFDSGITVANSGLKGPISDLRKYLRFLIGDSKNAIYDIVLKRGSLQEAWTGLLPTTATAGPGGEVPTMGLSFFVLKVDGHTYVYYNGDEGGFSTTMIVDPDRHGASIMVVNTTDTGPPDADPSRPQSNTEPDPKTDLRTQLREVLIRDVFPAVK
ncbi:MAG TPA: serine hydrolase domain-containing protein [Rhizomicrobium sp.]|jgi:CubicO group peptidase (beta-lactamase class C family)